MNPCGPPVSGPVTERAELVLAPNPGPMTFDGTNSWVVSEPGGAAAVVVDPGPDDPGHIDRLLTAARSRGATVAAILLTHRHGDHAAAARALAAQTGAPVLGWDPAYADQVLRGGELLDYDGLRVEVLATPGHSSDSLSFVLPADTAVLTGDTVLGRGSPAILHPEGTVGDMIRSLHAVRDRVSGAGAVVLPGHGPVVREPAHRIDRALCARRERLGSVAAARGGDDGGEPRSAAEIVAVLYPHLHPALRRAAESTVRAHLAHLDAAVRR